MQIWRRYCQPDDAGVLKQSPQHHWESSSQHLEDAAIYSMSFHTPAL